MTKQSKTKKHKVNPKVQVLKQYTDLIRELDILMDSYFTLRIKLMSPKTQHLKRDTVQTSMIDSTTEDLARMCDLKDRIESRREGIVAARIDIEELIDQVPESRLRIVLMNRYINGLSWEKVADCMNYNRMQIHRLHSQALNYITVKK